MPSSIYEVCRAVIGGSATEEDVAFLDAILLKPLIYKRFQVFKIKNIDAKELINDIYERMLTEGKKSKRCPLDAVLSVSACYSTQVERDKITYSQLKTTIDRIVTRLLGESDPRTRMYLKITTQLKPLMDENLILESSSKKYIRHGVDPSHSEVTNLEEIIGSIKWPRCKGKDQDMTMPSPAQIRDLILKVIEISNGGLSLDDLVIIFVKGFAVSRTVQNYSGNDEKSQAIFNEAFRKFDSERDFRAGIFKEVETVVDTLISEIEEVDGIPVEPKPGEKKGMLGKHFLDFTLWNGCRIKGEKRKFGLAEYRHLSGMSEGQGSKYNKDIERLPIFLLAKQKIINAEVMKEAMKELRIKFLHRKPKFIEDLYS